jgi:hypothetical protein
MSLENGAPTQNVVAERESAVIRIDSSGVLDRALARQMIEGSPLSDPQPRPGGAGITSSSMMPAADPAGIFFGR